MAVHRRVSSTCHNLSPSAAAPISFSLAFGRCAIWRVRIDGGVERVKDRSKGVPMTRAGEHRDWRAAFDEELRELRKRSTGAPDSDDRIGLAFSGGGIRSATFGLGV